MSFNSLNFAIFFAVVYIIYVLLNHRWQNRLLLVASYIFYGYWDYRFVALLLASTVVHFYVGQAIDHTKEQGRRKLLLTASVVFSLSLLGFFKYYNFFIDSLATILSHWNLGISTLGIILPVGISFYTFQTMTYTVDIYRGKLKPTNSFLDFALFASFFPLILSGPIERAINLLPQITKPRQLNEEQIYTGMHLIFWGLFKKMFVADNLGVLVNYVFNNYASISGLEIAIGIVAFSFQIYGDFSGYTDIAWGISKLLGFELMLNFNLPYFATNPSDFWRRWHISLSSWLRDYLYIPLGGNRHGTLKTYWNLMITMVLGGLWHGAAWTFVLWGFYQGLLLVVHRIAHPWIESLSFTKTTRIQPLSRLVSIVVTFTLVCIGWLFFHATSIEQIFTMLARIVTHFSPVSTTYIRLPLYFAYYAMPLIIVQLIQYIKDDLFVIRKLSPVYKGLFYFAALTLFLSSGVTGGQAFIYFQF